MTATPNYVVGVLDPAAWQEESPDALNLAAMMTRRSLPARSEPAAGPVAEDEKVAAFRRLPANRYRRDLAGRPVAGRGLAAARWLPPRRSS